MDDLERNLRSGLSAEVGDWSPMPSGVRRTAQPAPGRRLRLALALAVVLIASAGGFGIAIGLPGGGRHSGRAILAADPGTPAPPRTDLPGPCPVERAGTCPSPVSSTSVCAPPSCGPGSSGSCAVAPPAGTPCADVGGESVPGASSDSHPLPIDTMPTAPTGPVHLGPPRSKTPTSAPTPRAKPTTGARPPAECTPADLHLTLATDQSSYLQTTPVAINVSSTATATCRANEPGVSIQALSDDDRPVGHDVWSTCHGQPPLRSALASVCTASLKIFTRAAHDEQGAAYSWDMVSLTTPAMQPLGYATPGRYLISYSWGPVTTTATITVTQPPDCTADQLSDTITADATSYARGRTATFSGSVRNTSHDVCSAEPFVENPTIADASGAVVWSCGQADGLPKGMACGQPSVPSAPQTLIPGSTLATREPQGRLSTAPSTWTWNLVHDGTKDADPGPVPDGTYTLDWKGVGIGTATPVTLTVTG